MTVEQLRARWGAHRPGLLGARNSYAVLCPLVGGDGGLRLLFEVRSMSLQRQPGEVCFPGGRLEPGESAAECALRETREELGIPPERVEVLGEADFICNQAGFLLQPVLGWLTPTDLAALRPSPAEVAETFTVPLSFFQHTKPRRYAYTLTPQPPENFPYDQVGVPQDYPWARGRVEVPVWEYGGHAVWGMTARIVEEIVKSADR